MGHNRTISSTFLVLLLVLLLSAACGPVTALPGAAPHSAPTPGPRETAAPIPTVVQPTAVLPNVITATPAPVVLTTPLTQPGADWITFTASGLSFAYPPDWSLDQPDHLQGANGYAWIEKLPTSGAALDTRCILAANRDKPAQYGAYPEIKNSVLSGDATACLILPSEDQPAVRRGEALYLLSAPSQLGADTVLALHADRFHILAITSTLHLVESSLHLAEPSAANQQPTPVSNCRAGQLPEGQHILQDGLRIDEYPVAPVAGCLIDQQPDQLYQAAAAGAPASRAAQMIAWQWGSQRLAHLNQQLAPFGYRVSAADKLFTITQAGQVVRAKLNWIGFFTANADGTDFYLPVMDSYNSSIYLLRPDGLHELTDWNILTYDRVFPVYVGSDLYQAAYDYQRYERPVNNPALVNIEKNGAVIATYSLSGAAPTGGPVRGLWSWDQHWLMELPGIVVQDGKLLNDSLGYAEMFTWRLLKDKPFYFYRPASGAAAAVHLSYNGHSLPVTYDQVIHRPDCCTSELLQMQLFENGLFFYARRAGTWYYVVVEAAAP